MVNGTRPAGIDQRPSLGTLVADIANDLSQLIRGEIDLAKTEMKESARRGATGGALLAITAALLIMVGLLVTWAFVYGLEDGTGWALWICFLTVAGVYLVIGIIVAIIGVMSLRRAQGPQQAAAEFQRTKEIIAAIPPNTPPASPPPAPATPPTSTKTS